MKTFAQWLYEYLISTDWITDDEYTEDDFASMEDILADDDLDVDEDELVTFADQYRLYCQENVEEPDFTGYEDLA